MKNKFILPIILLCSMGFSQEKDNVRTTLSGNWAGSRNQLKDSGIKINPRVSIFTEAGFQNDNNVTFGGKADVGININAEELGLWKGLNIITHTEYNFGQSQNGSSGAILPQNTALLLPGNNGADRFDITSLYFLQKIGSNKSLMVGKINMVDVASGTTFLGGAGIDTFESIAFVAPPSGLVPPYIFGSLLSIKTEQLKYTFGVYDPISSVNKSGLEKPFDKGVTFYSSIEKSVHFFGKTGAHNMKAVFSTQNGLDLGSLSDVILDPELAASIDQKKKRYYLGYSFHQYLFQNQENPNAGWGIFGNIGFSDSNPTPLDWSFILGLGGKSLFKSRQNDRWGVGFYHQSFSNQLRNSANDLNLKLEDENGLEAFYNFEVLPYFNVGLNTKIIKPAINKTYKNNLFIGLRTSIKI